MTPPRSIPFQRYADSNAPYFKELAEAASRVIISGQYIRGEETRLLEKELSESCGSSCCVAVSTGLDAIRLLFRSQLELGRLKEGAEVIVPANTFIASVLPLTDLGLRPIFADPSEADFNLDFNGLDKYLSRNTGAVLTVHLYGTPAWDSKVACQLRERGILVFEDNAQAIGAEASEEGFHGGKATGNLADGAAFSFYPGKNVGALGDAGAVTTSDAETADCIRTLANYGSRRKYEHEICGYNNRMDEIQAAMIRVKLRHLRQITDRRNVVAGIYDSNIRNPQIVRPTIIKECRQVWHQYVVRTKFRNEFRACLDKMGIETLIHYPTPVHLQKCYREKYGVLELPTAEMLANEIVSLPIANISDDEALCIARVINDFKV